MKLSQITISYTDRPTTIELPGCDQEQIIRSEADLVRFMNDHGNLECVQIDTYVMIPEFAAGRESYRRIKLRTLDNWAKWGYSIE